jgi:ATP-dependent DNA helicase RecG
MTPAELQLKLNELTALPAETEWVEFKEAKNSFDSDDLGKYFSALSNEANLKEQAFGWLIFGIKDKPIPRPVVGSQFRPRRPDLDHLKQAIAVHTSHRLTFEEIHEVQTSAGRVVMFQIPAALRGSPTSWKGHFYGRDHESLGPLNPHEYEQIRNQGVQHDWSAVICDGATLKDLDSAAIAFARREFKKKNPNLASEVDGWNDETFLNKAKVCIDGKVTRTAIILLGKPESDHFLSPAIARLTWILKGEDGIEKDYHHFGTPLILAVNDLFARIRNLTYRYMPRASLFPMEVTQYDSWVVRETIHNCIAHQDYTRAGRINVIEEPERLLFTNLGEFLPGSVEEVIRRDQPTEHYRNGCLAAAMVNFGMIDTVGSGIRRMFTTQRQRNFPMPDYELNEPGRVRVRLIGKVIDEKYTWMLADRTDLNLMDVIALDKVQKGKPLSDDEFRSLKSQKLVEGRRPNLFVSAEIAAATDDKEAYIRNRAFDKDHYKKMIVAYLEKFGEGTRTQIDRLLKDKISDALDDDQKKKFVENLLQEMKRDGAIVPDGANRWTKWRLPKTATESDN